MHLGIDFFNGFGKILEGKWKQVGTNIDEQSIAFPKSDLNKKKTWFSLGKTMILRVQGVEVGSKNR